MRESVFDTLGGRTLRKACSMSVRTVVSSIPIVVSASLKEHKKEGPLSVE